MSLLFYFIFISILLLICIQDFKEREISWWTIPVLLICSFFLESRSLNELFTDTIVNLIFIIINLLVITVYYSIKQGHFVNIINKQLGLGDVLFFVVCCFIFSIPNFILYFLLSMVSSIFLGVLIQKIFKSAYVPLAGIMASILVLLSLSAKLFSINFIQGENWFNSLVV